MRIFYNLSSLRFPMTGIGYYTQNMVLSVMRNYPEHELIGCQARQFLDHSQVQKAVQQEYTQNRKNAVGQSPSIRKRLGNRIINRCFKPRELRRIYYNLCYQKKMKLQSPPAVYHEPNFAFIQCKGKKITTMHDISVISCPQYHPEERIAFMKRHVIKSTKIADSIVVNCQFIKDELLDVFPDVHPNRIHIIRPGANECFKPRAAHEVAETLEKYQLQYKNFILCVATLEPRKNLVRLVKAYRALSIELKEQYPLVLVGDKGWLFDALLNEVRDKALLDKIIITNYLPQPMLCDLLSSAKLFVYPSLYEGFGLPVLEAMASGAPVITSNVSSLPEVCGPAGILVDPLQCDDISAAMNSVLTDQQYCDQLSQLGLKQASQFSWDSFAQELVPMYETLI